MPNSNSPGKSLGKCHELGAVLGRFGNEALGVIDGLVQIPQDRSRLNSSGDELLLHSCPLS